MRRARSARSHRDEPCPHACARGVPLSSSVGEGRGAVEGPAACRQHRQQRAKVAMKPPTKDGAEKGAARRFAPAIPEDVIFAEAIDEGAGDLQLVSERLHEHGMKAIA